MMQNKTIIKITALIALPVIFLTGCMSFNPKSMRTMESAIIESNPDLVIKSSTKFGVGALTIDFIDFAFIREKSLDISKISRAEIGIYELTGHVNFEDFELPMQAYGTGRCPQWDVIVRIREEDEQVLIVACSKDEKISAISMFVLEHREIVVINARGDFNAMVSSLVKNSTGNNRERQETASL